MRSGLVLVVGVLLGSGGTAVAAECMQLSNLKGPMETLRRCVGGQSCLQQSRDSALRRLDGALPKAAADKKCDAAAVEALKKEFEELRASISAAEAKAKEGKPVVAEPARSDCELLRNLKRDLDTLRRYAADVDAGHAPMEQHLSRECASAEDRLAKATADATCTPALVEAMRKEYQELKPPLEAAVAAQAKLRAEREAAPMLAFQKKMEDDQAREWLLARKYLDEKATLGESDKGDLKIELVLNVLRDFPKLKADCAGSDKALQLSAVKDFCAKVPAKDEAIKRYVGASAKAIVAEGLPAYFQNAEYLTESWGGMFDPARWAYLRDTKVALAQEEKSLKPLFEYAGLPYPAADVEKTYLAGQKAALAAVDKYQAKQKPTPGKSNPALASQAKAFVVKNLGNLTYDGTHNLTNVSSFDVVAFEPVEPWKVHRNALGVITHRTRPFAVTVHVKGEKYCRPWAGTLLEDHVNGKFGPTQVSAGPGTGGARVWFLPCK